MEAERYYREFKEKISFYIGLLFTIIGIFVLVYYGLIMNYELPFWLIIGVLWAISYGMATVITKKLISSLFYPTITLALLSIPPFLTYYLMQGQKESIVILCTLCVAVIAFALYTIFLYYFIFKPNKRRNIYIEANRKFYEERKEEEKDFLVNVYNNKNDRFKISRLKDYRHRVIIEKFISGELPHYEQIKEIIFVDYLNVYYAGMLELKKLSELNDNREVRDIIELKEPDSEKEINDLFELIKRYNYLDDKKFLLRDQYGPYINIVFHEFLTVRLSYGWNEWYLSYNDLSWNPKNSEEVLDFLAKLLNESIIFYENRLTNIFNVYGKDNLNTLLLDNHKFIRVYSAMKIYMDN